MMMDLYFIVVISFLIYKYNFLEKSFFYLKLTIMEARQVMMMVIMVMVRNS